MKALDKVFTIITVCILFVTISSHTIATKSPTACASEREMMTSFFWKTMFFHPMQAYAMNRATYGRCWYDYVKKSMFLSDALTDEEVEEEFLKSGVTEEELGELIED